MVNFVFTGLYRTDSILSPEQKINLIILKKEKKKFLI